MWSTAKGLYSLGKDRAADIGLNALGKGLSAFDKSKAFLGANSGVRNSLIGAGIGGGLGGMYGAISSNTSVLGGMIGGAMMGAGGGAGYNPAKAGWTPGASLLSNVRSSASSVGMAGLKNASFGIGFAYQGAKLAGNKAYNAFKSIRS